MNTFGGAYEPRSRGGSKERIRVDIASNSANSGLKQNSMMIMGNYAADICNSSELEVMREEKRKMNDKLDEFSTMLREF